MPITFNGTTTKLTLTGTMPSGVPLSIFARFKLNATGVAKTNVVFGIGQFGATRLYRVFINGTGDDKAYFQVNDGAGSNTLIGTSAAAQDVTTSILITQAGSTRRCYMGAGARTEVADGQQITWASANTFMVGAGPHADEHFLSGEVSDVCIWTSELTQANYDALDGGSSPSTISPGTIWEYWPLANSGDLTGINGRTFSASGLIGSTLSGNVTASDAVAAGTMADAGSSSLTGGPTLADVLAAGTLGTAPGTVTVPGLTNWSGGVQAGVTVPLVTLCRLTDGVQVAILGDQVANGAGDLAITHAALIPGTWYMAAGWNADGSSRFARPVLAA